MFSRHGLILAAPLAAALAVCAFAAPASAASNPLGCRASVAGASSSASPSAAPYVANSAETPCATDSAVASPCDLLLFFKRKRCLARTGFGWVRRALC